MFRVSWKFRRLNETRHLISQQVLSLLLYCAVQGDNVGLFVEKITNMEEDIQLHLKNVIEAVLKEVECGIINTTFITNVLCQSGMILVSSRSTSILACKFLIRLMFNVFLNIPWVTLLFGRWTFVRLLNTKITKKNSIWRKLTKWRARHASFSVACYTGAWKHILKGNVFMPLKY